MGARARGRVRGLADVEVSATPTLVDVSIGALPRQRSYSLRVRPSQVDLDAIARRDGLVHDALDGRLGPGDALGFDTFVTAMSIAYGLVVATVVMPSRLR